MWVKRAKWERLIERVEELESAKNIYMDPSGNLFAARFGGSEIHIDTAELLIAVIGAFDCKVDMEWARANRVTVKKK